MGRKSGIGALNERDRRRIDNLLLTYQYYRYLPVDEKAWIASLPEVTQPQVMNYFQSLRQRHLLTGEAGTSPDQDAACSVISGRRVLSPSSPMGRRLLDAAHELRGGMIGLPSPSTPSPTSKLKLKTVSASHSHTQPSDQPSPFSVVAPKAIRPSVPGASGTRRPFSSSSSTHSVPSASNLSSGPPVETAVPTPIVSPSLRAHPMPRSFLECITGASTLESPVFDTSDPYSP